VSLFYWVCRFCVVFIKQLNNFTLFLLGFRRIIAV